MALLAVKGGVAVKQGVHNLINNHGPISSSIPLLLHRQQRCERSRSIPNLMIFGERHVSNPSSRYIIAGHLYLIDQDQQQISCQDPSNFFYQFPWRKFLTCS